MNRGLWLVCTCRWAPLRRRPAVTCARNPHLRPTSTRPPRPTRWRLTGPSTRRRLRQTQSPSISPLRRARGTPGSTGTGTGLALNGPGTPATGRPRTRPTCSSVRASCSSTGGPSTTAPTGRARAATGPTATDTAAGPPLAHGARGPLWRPAPGAPSTTKDGGARQARRPGAAPRRAVPSRCAAATPDSTGAAPAARAGAPAFHPAPAPAFHPAPAARSAPSHGGGGRMHH